MMRPAHGGAARKRSVVAVAMAAVALELLFGHGCRGAPIPAPNLEQCSSNGVVQTGPFFPAQRIQCCPVVPTRPVVNFSAAGLDKVPLRVRKPAHLLSERETARLDRAYRLMRSLPDDDPRSLRQQERLHCAYCASSLPVPWDPDQFLQIHWSWLLLPWHRWFLFFHERILASLLDDPTFALPFWNWDNYLDMDNSRDESGRFRYLPAMMPRAYFEEPDLALANRSVARAPPTLLNLNFNPFRFPEQMKNPPNLASEELRQTNLNIMHQVMVSAGTTTSIFMGQPYRYGANKEPQVEDLKIGILEGGPHGNVHVWVGNESFPDFADMGNLGISGKDPSFYIHHTNIDRLWEVWRTIHGGADITDPDWLDTEFVFYDENADLVRVRISDAVDISKLRYSYQSVSKSDAAWINYNATRCGNLTQLQAGEWTALLSAASPQSPSSPEVKNVTVRAGSPVTLSLRRPAPPPSPPAPSDDEVGHEEVLVLEDVRADWSAPAHLEAFVFLQGVTPSTSAACAELAGVLTTPPVMGPNRDRGVQLRLAIGSKLRQLGMAGASQVPVTLRTGPQHSDERPLRIGRARIVVEPTKL